MFLNGDFGEFFDKEFFIKLIGVDDVFQRTKARETTAYAGGVPVKKKPGGFGCGLQNTFHAGFRNLKIIVHDGYRISFFPVLSLRWRKQGLRNQTLFAAFLTAWLEMKT